jgi:hypothetical protein
LITEKSPHILAQTGFETPMTLAPVTSAQAQSDALPSLPVLPASPPPVPEAPEGFLDQLLAFIYTLAHWAGELIVTLLDNILPLQTPGSLVNPIGFLAILTVFLLVAEVAKKITWLIVVVGWVLIVIRIALEAMQAS